MHILSENLKRLRKKHNLTQLEMSKKLNIGRTTYATYEKGTNEPNLNTLLKISNIFSISIDDLLNKQENDILASISYDKLDSFNKDIYDKNILLKNLKEKKYFYKNSLEEFLINIPKKIHEIDELIEFIENKKMKNDTEFSSELSIDLKNLSDEKTSKVKNIDNYSKKKESVKIPVYDLSISAGLPVDSENAIIDKTRLLEMKKPLNEFNINEFYILKVKGDSMNNVVDDGEEILILGTNYVENGEIAVITLLNESESTLKHYYKINNNAILKPNSYNAKHHAQKYNLEEEEILIQGKYIGKVKDFLIESERD